jgi:hypothetical protein
VNPYRFAGGYADAAFLPWGKVVRRSRPGAEKAASRASTSIYGRTGRGEVPERLIPKFRVWNRGQQFRALLAGSSRNAAYQCIFAHIDGDECLLGPYGNILQIKLFWCCTSQRAGLIAMQKVVGSNPISRFSANVLHVGGSG